jgi:hypothetical protein
MDMEGQRLGIMSDRNGNNEMNVRVMKIFVIEN